MHQHICRSLSAPAWLVVLASTSIVACSAEASDPPSTSSNNSGGTPGTAGSKPVGIAGTFSNSGGSGPAGGSSSSSSSSGASTGGSAAMGAPTPLPVVVDEFFATSGYMADAQMGNATMTPLDVMGEMGDRTCEGQRAAADLQGACHIVTFTKFATVTWGGVYWQYPNQNWGMQPGLLIEPGATKIRFKARGESGGEKVGFFAGGIGLDNTTHLPMPGNKNYDGFWISGDAANTKTLTAEWTDYELDLTGKTYDKGVLGGFGWGVGQDGNTLPVKFYVDDIVWEK